MEIRDVFTWTVTLVCLTGTVLNVKRMRACFMLWIVGNIAWAAWDLSQGLFSRMLMDLVQLGLAVWGWVSWKPVTAGESGNSSSMEDAM